MTQVPTIPSRTAERGELKRIGRIREQDAPSFNDVPRCSAKGHDKLHRFGWTNELGCVYIPDATQISQDTSGPAPPGTGPPSMFEWAQPSC